jgi:predicted nucleic acid-binding protein
LIFVDTNVFMYAVGREHPLRTPARAWLARQLESRSPLATSAEVLQELAHAYLPVGRFETLDHALDLASMVTEVWPLEREDVLLARDLATNRPSLTARDVIHLACCRRRGVTRIRTFDKGLAAEFERG